MWIYQKNLEFPVNIKNPDPRMAKLLITQYGGAYCKSLVPPSMVLNLWKIKNTTTYSFSCYKSINCKNRPYFKNEYSK